MSISTLILILSVDNPPAGDDELLNQRPSLASGFPFPVPLSKIPENIYLTVRIIMAVLKAPGMSGVRAAGIEDPSTFMTLHRPYVPWITTDTEGGALPVDVVPPGVVRAGPIVLSSAPAAEQDPELVAWAARANTILVNLGSYFKVSYERLPSSWSASFRGRKLRY